MWIADGPIFFGPYWNMHAVAEGPVDQVRSRVHARQCEAEIILRTALVDAVELRLEDVLEQPRDQRAAPVGPVVPDRDTEAARARADLDRAAHRQDLCAARVDLQLEPDADARTTRRGCRRRRPRWRRA